MSGNRVSKFSSIFDARKKLTEEESDAQEPVVESSLTTTTHDSPPLTTTPQPTAIRTVAPARDFNKRANSLERDAMPAGLFPGSTFKVYNALYLRSLGAIVPSRRVRASRRDFLDWTDIRNLKTIDNHLRYLMAKRLIIRHWELGSTEGSEYEIFLPEEVSPPVTTTLHQSPPVSTSQNMTGGNSQFLGSGGDSQTVENTNTSSADKTLIKTNTDLDDEAFADFIDIWRKAAIELTGRAPSKVDATRWAELAELLVTELRIAASRTTVSNVPAFLTEHLRRRLWKLDKKRAAELATEPEQGSTPPLTDEERKRCPDCAGTNFWYPEGPEKGVARCTHQRLRLQGQETS